jgi:hypothetical protein
MAAEDRTRRGKIIHSGLPVGPHLNDLSITFVDNFQRQASASVDNYEFLNDYPLFRPRAGKVEEP